MSLWTRVSLTIAALVAVLAVFVAIGGLIGSLELLIIAVLFVGAMVVIWRPSARPTNH